MKLVWLLEHSYEKSCGCDEVKTLGIFSSEAEGRQAIAFYRTLPGFQMYPDGFHLEPYVPDHRQWTEGFGV